MNDGTDLSTAADPIEVNFDGERKTMEGVMKLETVPDFFQKETEDAVRSQVEWFGQ